MRWPAELHGRSERAVALALAATAAVAPLWDAILPGAPAKLTAGRILLAASLAATAWAMVAHRPGRPPRALGVFGAGMAALWLLATASATTRGCFCDGAWSGLSQFALLAVLVAVGCSLVPGARGPVLLGAVVGAQLAAALGLAGVHDVHAGVPVKPFPGRLAGPYGNPNALGFAVCLGFGALVLLALRGRSRAGRVVAGLATLAAAVALLQSYSRGAIVAAFVGLVVAAGALVRRPRDRVLLGLAFVVLTAGGLVVAYPAFKHARADADFVRANRKLAAEVPDRSGWDALQTGLLPSGPSRLANPGGGVLAVTGPPGSGVSHRLGDTLPRGRHVVVGFDARSDTPLPLRFGLEDNFDGLGPVHGSGRLTTRWQRFRVGWRPTGDADDPWLYVWQQVPSTTSVQLRDVRVQRQGAAAELVPTRLLGVPQVPEAVKDATERRYVRSRTDVLRLAKDAFLSSPLIGIGWETFPDYALHRNPSGALATHDEYTRIAAELGLLGVAALALAVAGAGLGLRRLAPGLTRDATGTVLASGAVGLLFINGLVVPTADAPLAVAVGVAASGALWRARPG